MSEEIYVTRQWLVDQCGFEIMALKDMLKRYGFDTERTKEGYPLSQIVRALNESNKVRGQRRTFNLAQLEEMKKQEEIIKLQLYNGEKNGMLILRSYAKERVRIVFQNVVSKIRYAIKNISPRLVGVDSARVIEEVMIKGWNGAIELLEQESKCVDWESDNPVTELSSTKPLTTYDTELDKIGNVGIANTNMESLTSGGFNMNAGVLGNIPCEEIER